VTTVTIRSAARVAPAVWLVTMLLVGWAMLLPAMTSTHAAPTAWATRPTS